MCPQGRPKLASPSSEPLVGVPSGAGSWVREAIISLYFLIFFFLSSEFCFGLPVWEVAIPILRVWLAIKSLFLTGPQGALVPRD